MQAAPVRTPSPWFLASILALALGLRFIHLTSPPLGIHSWRQADTAAIARNFAEHGYRFLLPEIDWGGDGSPYIETEFPAYQFVIALAYRLVGEHDWVGRLLSALASAATVYVLFRLVRLLIDETTALWSALFYAILPLNVYYGRTIQPESAMHLCTALGVYAMAEWSVSGRGWWLAASWAGATMACLLKLPAMYIGLPLLVLCWMRLGPRALLRWSLWLYAAALLACVAAWYAHAHALGQQSGNSFGILNDPKHSPWLTLADPGFYHIILIRRLAERLFTWPGFLILLIGLCLPRRARAERLVDWWLGAVLVYFAIAAFNNSVHEYYQLPFMLPGVVYLGRVYAQGWDRWRVPLAGVLALIVGLGAGRIAQYARLERTGGSADFEAARAVASMTRRGDKIVTVDLRLGANPTVLYLADRKGWALPVSGLDRERLEALAQRGATCLAVPLPPVRTPSEQEWLAGLRSWFDTAYQSDRAIVVRLRAGGPR